MIDARGGHDHPWIGQSDHNTVARTQHYILLAEPREVNVSFQGYIERYHDFAFADRHSIERPLKEIPFHPQRVILQKLIYALFGLAV